METLVSGTKEFLTVRCDDRLEAIDDLTPLSPLYDVLDKDDIALHSNDSPNVDLMRLYCLIDTTVGYGVGSLDPWPSGIYRLYVKFSASPEAPLHGPFPFRVEVR